VTLADREDVRDQVADVQQPRDGKPDPTGRVTFLPAPRTPLTWQRILLAAVVVAAGVLVSLARVRKPGPLNSIIAEDGTIFLNQAWNRSFPDAVLSPFSGYFHIGPRLLAENATVVPPQWAPAALTVQAAFIAALMALAVYSASAGYLRHPLSRLIVSVPALAMPWSQGILGGESGPVDNNVATLQFPALYATFWMLLWMPARRGGRCVAAGVVLFTATSSMLAVAFLPLAAYRVAVCRDRFSAVLAAGLTAAAGLQVAGLLSGATSRGGIGRPRPDPAWVATEYASTLVPRAVLGDRWLAPPVDRTLEHLALVLLAWLIVAAALVLAARRMTAPRWWLAALAAGHSVALFGVQIAAHGSVPARYVVAPALLLVAALAAVTHPAALDGIGSAPAVALATLLAVVSVANLRMDTYRSAARPWHERLAEATAACAEPGRVKFTSNDRPELNWPIDIPCRLLR